MRDFDAFERRFVGLLRDYADAMPVVVDPVAVADRLSGQGHRSWRGRFGIGFGKGWRMSWLIAALLLVGLLGIGLMVGAKLLERDQAPLGPSAFDVTMIAPGQGGSPDIVTASDGAVWAVVQGVVTRIDPTTGSLRSWDISDGPAFAGPRLAVGSDSGVWLVAPRVVRHFDGASLGSAVAGPDGVEYLSNVVEAPDGTLWAASDQGLFRYRDGRWTDVGPDPADGSSDQISTGSIAVDASGAVWASLLRYPGPTARGIGRFDGSRWEITTDVGDGTRFPVITSLTATPDGDIWAGADAGSQGRLYRYDGSGWRVYEAEPLDATGAWRVATAPGGTVLAATEFRDGAPAMARIDRNGVVEPISVTGLPVPAADGWSELRIAALGNTVMAAMPSGLYRLTGERWERIWPATDRATTPLLDLAAVDRDTAWGVFIGAASGGTAREVWQLTASGAMTEEIGGAALLRDLTAAADGTPWVASSVGVSVRTPDGWRVVDHDAASAVATDPAGAIWVAQGHAIRRLESKDGDYVATAELTVPRFDRWVDAPAYLFPLIGSSMAMDGQGDAWLSGGARGYFESPGLYRVDRAGAQAMAPVADSDRTVFDDVTVAPDGAVWATIDGVGSWSTNSSSCCEWDPAAQVVRFDDGRWTVYGKADGLPSWANEATSLAVAPSGDVWLSTMFGLYRFEGTRWTAAIPEVDLGSISIGRDGTIWASGINGVVRLTPRAR